MIKVQLVIGTRPEAIKMAPLLWELRRHDGEFCTRVVYTGQHRELVEQVTDLLRLRPDCDLEVMSEGQSMGALCSTLLQRLDTELERNPPDVVLAQGDTATVAATSMACFYRRIPFEHVEAGLRTGDMTSPFPEEANRRVASLLASYHYAPTVGAQDNLLSEGITPSKIEVTGNTVVDALQHILRQSITLPFEPPKGPWILVTLHRRESIGEPLERILQALVEFLNERPEVSAVVPVHPNPDVSSVVRRALYDLPNAKLLAPLRYDEFIFLLRQASAVLSDSGGVQEEAPTVHTPLLIAREHTGRPEGLYPGLVELVGSDLRLIKQRLNALVASSSGAQPDAWPESPYGDGNAARRIVDSIRRRYGSDTVG